MAEIVNLNRARKAKARTDKQARAASNRVKHGRTMAEKAKESAEASRLRDLLDGAHKEPDGQE